ncbi:MAG: hypothetical protein JXQ75_14055 [Phycisphaerae bacterium]|nr:hypothetical protein [Phycisphaerae bacterium]
MILIRCDGGKGVGLGHVRRSLLVGQALRERLGLAIHAVFREDPIVESFLTQKGIHYTCLPATIQSAAEMAEICSLMSVLRPAVLWVDVLDRARNRSEMRPLLGKDHTVCAVSDENTGIPITADLAFLPSPGHCCREPRVANGTTYYYGPKYFVMDPRYAEPPLPEESRENKVMISLGGTDQNDLLLPVLSTVVGCLKRTWTVEVVVGTSYRGRADARAVLEGASFGYRWAEDADDLPQRMRTSKVAITASGNTLFERLAAGVAGIAVSQSARQAEHATILEALAVTKLGCGSSGVDKELLTKNLNSLLEDRALRFRMARKGREIVDGFGLRRVVDAIENNLKKKGVE